MSVERSEMARACIQKNFGQQAMELFETCPPSTDDLVSCFIQQQGKINVLLASVCLMEHANLFALCANQYIGRIAPDMDGYEFAMSWLDKLQQCALEALQVKDTKKAEL